jgi:hypothetical protein
MKQAWPLTLIIVGLLLVVSGLVYDVMFAGIPYQDPTPEMSARYAFHSRIASIFYLTGAGVFVTGSIAGLIRRLVRSFKSRG